MRIFLLSFIFLFSGIISPLFAGDTGIIGVNPGLDFYSRIDESASSITNGLMKKRVNEYKTFAGFGRHCRSPQSWLDSEPLSQRILDEIYVGYFGSLETIMQKKRVSMTSDSFNTLFSCLRETYISMQIGATKQYESLTTMGSMGIYSDGNTSNSDYDIVTDIEKINSIIFSENLPYEGSPSSTPSSLGNLLAGKNIPPLIDPLTRSDLNSIFGNAESSSGESSSGQTLSGSAQESSPTLQSLGLAELCSSGSSSTGVKIENMINDTFMNELSLAMAGASSNTQLPGTTYSTRDLLSGINGLGFSLANPLAATSKGDFFSTPRCENIFCIKVSMAGGSAPGLTGGKNISIEGILDKHIGMLEPISWTDLSLQKMTNNHMQLPYTGLALKLKSKVKGGGVFVGSKPTPKEMYKKDETKDTKDKKMEQFMRCALYSAGFSSSDLNKANSVLGAGYTDIYGQNLTNKNNTASPLGPTNTEDQITYQNCLPIANNISERKYYESLGSDLGELETFTDAMGKEIFEILGSGEKIDTLKVK